MTVKKETGSFEKSLEELETIVSNLENESLSLEEGLESFSKGVKLYKDCRAKLQAVEKKVAKLTEDLEVEDL